MKLNFDRWDWHHTMLFVASALIGAGNAFLAASWQYLQAQPTASLMQAFTSIDAARPIVMGALSVGAVAVITLAKSSFIAKPPAPATPMARPGPTLDYQTLIREGTPKPPKPRA